MSRKEDKRNKALAIEGKSYWMSHHKEHQKITDAEFLGSEYLDKRSANDEDLIKPDLKKIKGY